MKLIDAIAQGLIMEFGQPQQTIDTLMSKVFLFSDQAVKVYKHRQAFYGDLSELQFRQAFYKDDFFWNQQLAPDVYLHLGGVKINNGKIVLTDMLDEADDFYILMKKIDGQNNLTKLLQENKITALHLEALTTKIIDKQRLLTTKLRAELEPHFTGFNLATQLQDLEDLGKWGDLSKDYIDQAQMDDWIDALKTKITNLDYFNNFNQQLLTVGIDHNCDNFLIIDDQPSFIDIMPPKTSWRVNDELAGIARLSVDTLVLGNQTLSEVVYQTYANYRPLPDAKLQLIYELKAGLIQWPYRHTLGQHDLADKYQAFLIDAFKRL
jgi:aminoglycoside phosphotransferase family enzyme